MGKIVQIRFQVPECNRGRTAQQRSTANALAAVIEVTVVCSVVMKGHGSATHDMLG
jgi:hypothetical protein